MVAKHSHIGGVEPGHPSLVVGNSDYIREVERRQATCSILCSLRKFRIFDDFKLMYKEIQMHSRQVTYGSECRLTEPEGSPVRKPSKLRWNPAKNDRPWRLSPRGCCQNKSNHDDRQKFACNLFKYVRMQTILAS